MPDSVCGCEKQTNNASAELSLAAAADGKNSSRDRRDELSASTTQTSQVWIPTWSDNVNVCSVNHWVAATLCVYVRFLHAEKHQ